MKKTKYIALMLVLMVTLMGVGYAAWNEIITVSSTVDTGELKVVFAHDNGRPYAKDPYNTPAVITGTAVQSSDNKTLTVTLNNIYPGYNNHGQGVFTASIQNQGTIPAKFEKVVVTDKGTDALLAPKLWYWIGLELYRDNDTNPLNEIPYSMNQKPVWSYSIAGTGINNMTGILTQAFNKMNTDGFTLNPGDVLRFDIPDEDKIAANLPLDGNSMYFGLHQDLGNEYQGLKAMFDIQVNWEQFNS